MQHGHTNVRSSKCIDTDSAVVMFRFVWSMEGRLKYLINWFFI
jgi:hypothetical protein